MPESIDLKREQLSYIKQITGIVSDFVACDPQSHYRNKMEYPFYAFDDERISLACHKPNSARGLIPFEGSDLAKEEINIVAREITNILNTSHIFKRQLKGVMLRYSYLENKVVAVLFVKNKDVDYCMEKLTTPLLKGIAVYYSDPKSPAYLFTEKLYENGSTDLKEKIGDYVFDYPVHGFFQVNPVLFTRFILDLKSYLSGMRNFTSNRLLDLYCGVGTIGISISEFFKEVVGIELFQDAARYALMNTENNKTSNYSCIEGKCEKEVLDMIKPEDIIFLDPPRSGCHIKLINTLINIHPKYVFYVSCNPKTQLMDYNMLKDIYSIEYSKVYDFFPQTEHLEHLIVLKAKDVN